MTLVSDSEGILFSFNIQFKGVIILSKPLSPEANNISITIPDVPEALLSSFYLRQLSHSLYLFVGEVQLLDLLRPNFLYPKGTLH